MPSAALVIGIDDYKNGALPLTGCVKDSERIAQLLKYNYDPDPNREYPPANMDVRLLNDKQGGTTAETVRERIGELFASQVSLAVLYFSGHGATSDLGGLGSIIAADTPSAASGINMHELMAVATKNQNQSKSVVIILDCCHAGMIGQNSAYKDAIPEVKLPLGVTLLASSRENQTSSAGLNGSVFTNLLCDGLAGGCADMMGRITPAALYFHVDQSMRDIGQRPIFATNIQRSVVVRKARPKIDSSVLRELPALFPDQDQPHPLDPEYEEDRGKVFDEIVDGYGKPLRDIPPDPGKVEVFGKLQALTRCGLVRPREPEAHMFWAAVHSGSCELTELGRHYWYLAKNNRIRD